MPNRNEVMPVKLKLSYPPSEPPEEQAAEVPEQREKISPEKLKTILEEHKKWFWVESRGKEGEQANLQEADLYGANLQEADLREANLKEADFGCANLEQAHLHYTNLQKADLTAVKNFTQAQLDQACVDKRTKLPEGLTRPEPCSKEELSQK
jgi:hypothetical protein